MKNKILDTYIFFFIFNMYNREFNVIFDIRYLILALGMIIFIRRLMVTIKSKKIKIIKKKNFILINIMFFFIFFSNIMWEINGLSKNSSVYNNSLILLIYNYIFILNIYMNYKELDNRKIIRFVNFSYMFLFISMLLTYIGVDIHSITQSSTRTFTIEKEFSPLGIRIAGYAEDANYASLLSVITPFINYLIIGKVNKLILISSIVGYIFSFSKTVLIVLLISLIFLFIEMLKNNNIMSKLCIFVSLILISLPLLSQTSIFNKLQMSTMTIRFNMWESGLKLFTKSPILGSGTTSARSFFELDGGWYVQIHNTFLTLFAEYGIIVLIIFTILIISQYKHNNRYYNIVIMLLVGLCSTYDIVIYPFIYFVIGLLSIIVNKNQYELKNEVE